MKVIAVIQARTGSTRLPGKVLLPLAGKSVLEHVVRRVERCTTVNLVVVATTIEKPDDKIESWCNENNVVCFRGSVDDVLDRYYQAAKNLSADVIVRVTADCPLIDPKIIDEVLTAFNFESYDLFSLSGEFPDGLDCQVFSMAALERAWCEAVLRSDREHVGAYIERTRRDLFRVGGLKKFKGFAHYRWTLDEPQDYEFLQKIFSRLGEINSDFDTSDVLSLLAREPQLMEINSGIIRNEGYLRSLSQDV